MECLKIRKGKKEKKRKKISQTKRKGMKTKEC